MLLVSVAVVAVMPPPLSPAVLPLTVLLVSVAVIGVPDAAAVTPSPAELPLTVLLVSVAVVPMPPPRRPSCR